MTTFSCQQTTCLCFGKLPNSSQMYPCCLFLENSIFYLQFTATQQSQILYCSIAYMLAVQYTLLNYILSAILFCCNNRELQLCSCTCTGVKLLQYHLKDLCMKYMIHKDNSVLVFDVCFSKCDCTYICGKIANCSKFPHIIKPMC